MTSDDKGKGIKETIADEVKGIAIEVYKDAAKPSVTAVGTTLGDMVKLALRPLNLLVQGGERLMSAVQRKLAGVPADRLLPPPATIAAPAALQYALLGEAPEAAELREMFENLLAASMDGDTASGAHPAFVSVIQQLTPDEAWILKSIDRDDYALVNMFDRRSERHLIGRRTLLGTNIEINKKRFDQHISNLERLGILQVSEYRSTDIGGYEQLMTEIKKEFASHELYFREGSLNVTPFGVQFLDTCLRYRPSAWGR